MDGKGWELTNSFSSWWFQPTRLKNGSQIGSFLQVEVEINKYLSRHHLVLNTNAHFVRKFWKFQVKNNDTLIGDNLTYPVILRILKVLNNFTQ